MCRARGICRTVRAERMMRNDDEFGDGPDPARLTLPGRLLFQSVARRACYHLLRFGPASPRPMATLAKSSKRETAQSLEPGEAARGRSTLCRGFRGTLPARP